MQRLRTIIFPIDFDVFLKFRGSMLGGKIDLGVSWRPLGASWRRLGGLLGHLRAILERLGGVLRRLGGVLGRLGRVKIHGIRWVRANPTESEARWRMRRGAP